MGKQRKWKASRISERRYKSWAFGPGGGREWGMSMRNECDLPTQWVEATRRSTPRVFHRISTLSVQTRDENSCSTRLPQRGPKSRLYGLQPNTPRPVERRSAARFALRAQSRKLCGRVCPKTCFFCSDCLAGCARFRWILAKYSQPPRSDRDVALRDLENARLAHNNPRL
jgi:hypothetical protein